LRLIGPVADDVLALYRKAQRAYDMALRRVASDEGRVPGQPMLSPRSGSRPCPARMPWHPAPVTSTKTVRQLVDRLYDACFVTIAYLVGPRVSEILGLKVGCIEHHRMAEGDEAVAYLTGTIFKTARSSQGEVHRWIALSRSCARSM
jgi:integrase